MPYQVPLFIEEKEIYKISVKKIYKLCLCFFIMGTYPPDAQKREMKCNIDRKVYDEFAKTCSRKGFAMQIVVQKLMEKFNQTGQI